MITRKGAGAAETRRFVWAGSRIAEEKDGQNNLVKRYFRQGVQVVSGDKAGLYYYTRDHLGSIRELTDSTGAVRARYGYDLWGKRTKISGDIDADFGFTGYWELENGLKLTWYRTYSPGLGKWLSRDPIEEKGGLNLYAYVMDNSIINIDKDGLINASEIGAALAGLEAACTAYSGAALGLGPWGWGAVALALAVNGVVQEYSEAAGPANNAAQQQNSQYNKEQSQMPNE
jgi:RHS repeat-associated protein